MEARLALRMTARLTERTAELPQDVTERLRFAREQALARAQAARAAAAPRTTTTTVHNGSGTLSLGTDGRTGWWMRLAAWMPLVALIAGLIFIQRTHTQNQIVAAAEIDAFILTDDLPPAAYSDPGFVEFLKTPRD